MLRMRGDLDGGLAYLNDVLSREPQNFSAHLGRANLLVAKNQLDVAGQEIRAILAEVPDDFQANYLQALIDARQNRLDQANARLQKFIPEFRDYPVGFLLLGDVQFAQGKLSEAEDNLTKFLGRVPNNPMATKLAAEIAIREGSLERASRYLEALLKVTPNDAGAWVLLANAYLAEGKNDEASQALTHATAMGTSDPNFETELASTRYAAGETDQAIQQLDQVFQETGGVQIAGPALILADLRSNRVSDAAAHAEAYAKANPDNPIALNLLGLARVAQTDLANAEKIFAGIYQQHPDFPVAGRNLAEVYIAQGRPDDAIATYRDLVRRNAADVRSLMALSNVALANHDLAGATDALRQAVNAAPNEVPPGLALARLYASQKDWNDATMVVRGLLATLPNDIEVLDAMARLQIASGDLAGAVTTYRQATQIAPTNATLFERYAAALVAANDLNSGRAAMRRAILLDPRNIGLKQEEVEIEYKIGGLAAAQAAAKSMTKPGDDPATVSLWTATALAREGKVADASAILAAVEKTHPTQTVILEHALILAGGGNAAGGTALLKPWLDAHPDDLSVRRALADLDLNLKNYAAAQAEYERLLAAFPTDVAVLERSRLELSAAGQSQGAGGGRAGARSGADGIGGRRHARLGYLGAGRCPGQPALSQGRFLRHAARPERAVPSRRGAIAHRQAGRCPRDAGQARRSGRKFGRQGGGECLPERARRALTSRAGRAAASNKDQPQPIFVRPAPASPRVPRNR